MCLRTFEAGAVFVMLGCSYPEQQSVAAANEIIVKFAAGESINDTIVQAFDDTNAETSLEESVVALSDELDIPFDYSRLTSGREIVIEIPTGRVFDRIAEHLRGSDDVENVVIESHAASDVPNVPNELLVTVDRAKIESGPGVDANALGARLVGDDRFPVICEFRTDGRLVVTPDFERLVGTLAEELTSRPDIDYAQPNYRVRHYNRIQ